MLFSIQVPMYNTRRYIEECIQSVLEQKYENWELIIIDDGSTDGCADIAKTFAQKETRIKYYYQDNSGVSAARNLGIKKASGDYVIFVDSDDKIRNDTLQRIAEIIERKACDIVVYNIARSDFDETDVIPFTTPFKDEELYIKSRAQKKEYIFSALTSKKILGVMGNFAVKTELIRENCFCEDMVMYEDLIFDICMYEKAETVVCIPEYLYYYRDNVSGAVNSFNFKKLEDLKKAYKKKKEIIDKYDLVQNEREVIGWFLQELVYNYYRIIMNRNLCKDYCKFIYEDREIREAVLKAKDYKIMSDVKLYKIIFGNNIEKILHREFIKLKKIIKQIVYGKEGKK